MGATSRGLTRASALPRSPAVRHMPRHVNSHSDRYLTPNAAGISQASASLGLVLVRNIVVSKRLCWVGAGRRTCCQEPPRRGVNRPHRHPRARHRRGAKLDGEPVHQLELVVDDRQPRDLLDQLPEPARSSERAPRWLWRLTLPSWDQSWSAPARRCQPGSLPSWRAPG